MPRLDAGALVETGLPESSAQVASRISLAWQAAVARNGGHPNAALRGQRLLAACALDRRSRETLTEMARGLQLTARSVHRILRVARTVADLRQLERVSSNEILAATSLRDRSIEMELAA